MAQVLSGIRSVLSHSLVYDVFQSVVGGVAARRRVCAEYVRASPADIVIDVGCGTGDVLRFLPQESTYYGFDLSQQYIDKAKLRHAGRENCSFRCTNLNDVAPDELPLCDIAIIFGVLHHISDLEATRLLSGIHSRLAPHGRVVCMDPAIQEGQSRIARYLISNDRGQNVRSADAYASLVPASYSNKNVVVRDDLFYLPYTLSIMCLEK